MIALVPATALAAEIASGDTVIIDSPVNDDLYVFGSDIRIAANVEGDVIAFGVRVVIDGDVTGSIHAAAAEVIVASDVGGSVMAAAESAYITGSVGHAVRVAARSATIDATNVDGDVVAAASMLRIDNDSTVGGDVVLRVSDAEIDSAVDGEIRGSAGTLRIGGNVGGEIDIRVDTLRFTEGARITEPVEYTSDREVLIDGGTVVTANLARLQPDHPTLTETLVGSLLWATFRFMWGFALGLFFLWLMPCRLREMADIVISRPLGSLGWGAAAFVLIPLVIVFLLITVVGIPVALLVAAAWVVALYSSQIVVGLALGRVIIERVRDELYEPGARTLALGVGVLALLRSLPLPSWYPLIALVTVIIALGAMARYFAQFRPRQEL